MFKVSIDLLVLTSKVWSGTPFFTSGSWFDGPVTVTKNVVVLVPPLPSFAVKVIVALPTATPVIFIFPPDTDTVTLLVLSELAVIVKASPSGSLKMFRVSIDLLVLTSKVWSGTPFFTSGSWFDGGVTVTVNVAVPVPPLTSVAVKVIVAVPSLTPVTVIVEPDTDTVAVPAALDTPVIVKLSPSGSLKIPAVSISTLVPTTKLLSATPSFSIGSWLVGGVTVTVKVVVTLSPSGSVARTSTSKSSVVSEPFIFSLSFPVICALTLFGSLEVVS